MKSSTLACLRRFCAGPCLLMAAAGLLACKSRAAQLEEQLAIAEGSNAAPERICQMKRAIAQAYLEARDEERYHTADLYAETYCYSVQQQRLLRQPIR